MRKVTDLPFTIPELRAAYAEGLAPRDVAAEFYRRLSAADDPGIFVSLADETALTAEADRLGAFDPALPLWGMPVAVKDNIDVAGMATTVACPDYAYVASEDAEAVARLRAAGALIVGKTNLDQFATGLVGVRTPYPVPRNPIAADLIPGGSSSGSAVAVARGIVAAALGTDTAGSGRVPAALNNIVGLKPSLGAVSTRGVVPACQSLDCISVFALTVEDAWTVFAAVAGYDSGDPYSRRLPSPHLQQPVPGIRIGVPRMRDRGFGRQEDVHAFQLAMASLAGGGAELTSVDFTDLFAVARLLYDGPWLAERYSAIRPFIDEHPEALLPVTREIISRGAAISAADTFDGLHRLRELAAKIEPIWDEVDVLCVPTIPRPCTLADIEADPLGRNAELGIYTNFVNLLGLCALAVPAQWRGSNRPSGITLIGRDGADGLLATIGRRVHVAAGRRLGATDWPMPVNAWPLGARSDAIAVVVFGAHLSGLPLNGELTRAGAEFLEAVRTAPDYRMFALAGLTERPGLVRVEEGQGTAVEGEIWLLPPEGFGRFVDGIAPPLAIGSVRLEDGRLVKGFLAETEGVRGAPDISRHGGWRSYLRWKAEANAPAK